MEIISVHVPKTAGTTFANVLIGHYGLDRMFKDYEGEDLRSIGPDKQVIHGHFNVCKYHGLFPEARRIAWIRHPVAWLISFYYFARHQPRPKGNALFGRLHDENLSLLEFAEHPFSRDFVSRNCLYGVEPEDLFFVGITEHFREDMAELSHQMGWPEVDFAVDNANPEPRYHDRVREHLADQALVRRLEALNPADMALYEKVLRMRGHSPQADEADADSRPTGRFGSLLSLFRPGTRAA